MTYLRPALVAVAILTAAPAFAGGNFAPNLPNLSFPKPVAPETTQDCTLPADGTKSICE